MLQCYITNHVSLMVVATKLIMNLSLLGSVALGFYSCENNESQETRPDMVDTMTVVQSADQTIKDIETRYEHIRDNLEKYDSTMAYVFGASTEGGQVTGYSDRDSIKLWKVWLLGETYKRRIEYYFDSGQLFFVYHTNYRYNRPIYWDENRAKQNNDTAVFDAAKTVTEEDRYYFYNGRLILWTNALEQQVDSTLDYYKILETEILRHSDKMRAELWGVTTDTITWTGNPPFDTTKPARVRLGGF